MIFLNLISFLVTMPLWIVGLVAVTQKSSNQIWINGVLIGIGLAASLPTTLLAIVFIKKCNDYFKRFKIMSKHIEF